MRVLVVGPGALGIATAVRLQAAGHDVQVAVRSAKRAKGLPATLALDDVGRSGQEVADARYVHRVKQAGTVDALVLATKCQAAPEALEKWLPAVAADGLVIPFQNGMIGDALAAIAGPRYRECVVYFPASLVADGHARITGAGEIHVGAWPRGPVDAGTERARALLDTVMPAEAHEDMFRVKWNKLVVNAAISSLGALTGRTMAGMMEDRRTRTAFIALVREGMAVAEAAGAPAMKVGSFSPRALLGAPSPVAHVALRLKTRRHGAYRSSSHQSLLRGEPTEVDYLNGHIVAEGERLGVPTPWHAAVVAAVHGVEAGRPVGLDAVPSGIDRAAIV